MKIAVTDTDQRQAPARDSESEGLGEAGRVSPVKDEREAFEAWAYYEGYRDFAVDPLRLDARYKKHQIDDMWRAWHACSGLRDWRAAQSSTNAIAQPVSADRAAYEGARADLLCWKRRAQRAEATLRSFGYTGIDASEAPKIPQPVSVEELSQPTRNGEVVMDPSVLDWEYMYGWNACLKAILSASPKLEGE